jgi:hypothetical protein
MATLEIGSMQRTFKPGADNLIAGAIIGLLMIGSGSTIAHFATKSVIERRGQLPFWAEEGWCWGAVALCVLLSVGLVIGGGFLIRWLWSLSSLQVHVGDDGFAVTRRDGQQLFMWDRIVHVKETHMYERPPILKGPVTLLLPKMKSKSYSVRRDDQEEFAFDGNTLRGHEAFAELLKARVDGRNIPWEIVEVHA